MRVIEAGHCLGFTSEPKGEVPILADLRRQDLKCHESIEPRLPRFVNGTHAAATEKFQNLQNPESWSQVRQAPAVSNSRTSRCSRFPGCSIQAPSLAGRPGTSLPERRRAAGPDIVDRSSIQP